MLKKEVELFIISKSDNKYVSNVTIEIEKYREFVNHNDIEKFLNQTKFIDVEDGFRLDTSCIESYSYKVKGNRRRKWYE